MSGLTTNFGGAGTCRGLKGACGAVSAAACGARGWCCAEGTTTTWGSVELTPVSCGCSQEWSNPQESGGCGSLIPGRQAPTRRVSGCASHGWGSRIAATGRYEPTGLWLAPSAVSGSVRRTATPRVLTRGKGSRCTDSRTDCGTDRTAARIARSGEYRLAISVHRSTSP